MTFAACLAGLEADGTIDPKRAVRLRALYEQMEARFTKQYGAGPGAVLAGEETLKALDHDAQLRRRQAALQIEAQRNGLKQMEEFDGGSGKRPVQAVQAIMARDPSGRRRGAAHR